MMIITTNILAAPLVALVWAADTYVVLATLRLVLERVVGVPNRSWFAGLRQLTDGPAQWVASWVDQWRPGSPAWLPWSLVIASALAVRHLLLALIVTLG